MLAGIVEPAIDLSQNTKVLGKKKGGGGRLSFKSGSMAVKFRNSSASSVVETEKQTVQCVYNSTNKEHNITHCERKNT